METCLVLRGGLFQIRMWTGGQGDPLLYLHGFDGHPGWSPFLSTLAERYTVYAPEHPGFGQSTGLEHLDDILDITLYYEELLDALHLHRVHIVGHDLGGMFAAELAAIDRHRVQRLVLVDPFGLWLDDCPIPDFFAMGREELLQASWYDAASAVVSRATQPVGVSDPAQAFIERTKALAAAGKFLWPIPDRGLSKRLHRIAAPTLLIWGESDALVPVAYREAFLRAIPGAQLLVIPKAAHYPQFEQPEDFCIAIQEFLNSCDQAVVRNDRISPKTTTLVNAI